MMNSGVEAPAGQHQRVAGHQTAGGVGEGCAVGERCGDQLHLLGRQEGRDAAGGVDAGGSGGADELRQARRPRRRRDLPAGGHAPLRVAERRAGRVFNILKIMSQSPDALRSSMDLYMAIMFGKSPLSRAQREMLATVVSATNGCHY